MLHTIILALCWCILPVRIVCESEIDHLGAISDGFIHAAITDVVKEPIKIALNPQLIDYYICTESCDPIEIIQSKEKCYTCVLDYKVIIPPNPSVLFLANMVVILFMIMIVILCCFSSVEEKGKMCTYIFYHIIGQIIYDVLSGNND